MTDPASSSDPEPRRRVQDRRLAETRRVEHRRPDGNTTRIFVTVGYDPEAPTVPVEVFYSEGFRSGSDMEFTVQDACVLISLLLQHGIPPAQIAASMSMRDSAEADLTTGDFAQPDADGTFYGSLAGTIAAELAVPPAWALGEAED